ncbi:MAG TPA: hypothetical protein VFA65_08565 [Bryobacteraceae bacterium]|nr:hypothetical protein [Bryobacteraceae bacterium]
MILEHSGPDAAADASFANRIRYEPSSELRRDLRLTLVALSILIGAGLVVVSCVAIWGSVERGYTAFFWSLACLAGGALAGFLFGIPRVFQTASGADAVKSNGPTQTDSRSGNANGRGYQLLINTHLDDISDWLTKIAVGVGLVELEKMPRLLYQLSSVVARALTPQLDPAALVPFIMALLLYFTTAGFLTGYLATRMFIQRAFRIADLGAIEPDRQRVMRRTEVVETEEKTSTVHP